MSNWNLRVDFHLDWLAGKHLSMTRWNGSHGDLNSSSIVSERACWLWVKWESWWKKARSKKRVECGEFSIGCVDDGREIEVWIEKMRGVFKIPSVRHKRYRFPPKYCSRKHNSFMRLLTQPCWENGETGNQRWPVAVRWKMIEGLEIVEICILWAFSRVGKHRRLSAIQGVFSQFVLVEISRHLDWRCWWTETETVTGRWLIEFVELWF